MAWNYDIILRTPADERTFCDDYYFVKTDKKEYYRIPNRHGYVAVSFCETSKDYNYPVVFDDFTTNSHVGALEKVEYKDVPAKVKRKFTNWAKYQ
jgi:hypothetical protein